MPREDELQTLIRTVISSETFFQRTTEFLFSSLGTIIYRGLT